jgi:DNA segregation ATPase FtsK/SpoIIIE-like protein
MMVASQVDSRTIIDTPGAEKLRGSGDILYLGSDNPKPVRLQSLFISEDEILERVKNLSEPPDHSLDTIQFEEPSPYSNDAVFNAMVGEGEEDDLYEDAKVAVIKAGKASTSFIQRSLRVGYSRAARLLDLLEENGVIGPLDGAKPRVVIGSQEWVDEYDPLDADAALKARYKDARKAVIEARKASTSYLQRKLRIGYSAAAQMMDLLEERGVIGPADGSKPREVLTDKE